jgi:hypothetical protein
VFGCNWVSSPAIARPFCQVIRDQKNLSAVCRGAHAPMHLFDLRPHAIHELLKFGLFP